MDVDKLEAGPGTDALVAETVMGWQTVPNPDGSLSVFNQADEYLYLIGCEESYPDCAPPWRPSTDWAAAGEVIEKLHSPDASITLETGIRNGESVWWCVFIIDDDRHKYAAADTPQLAICRAALKAVKD